VKKVCHAFLSGLSILQHFIGLKMTVFWDVAVCSLVEVKQHFRGVTASIIRALLREAVKTSKTSVNFYQTTRRNIPEDSHLHTRRREKLKSHHFTVL
jgi:hypothetical protein